MASAPPQLPLASSLSSLDPIIKPNTRIKNAWSQIVRGDAVETSSLEKQQNHHQQQQQQPQKKKKNLPEHPQRQSQPQPPQQQQQLLPPEPAIEAAAMIPSAPAATESASGMLLPSPNSPPPAPPAACSSVAAETKPGGDSLSEDSESVTDHPDRSEVDTSVGESATEKAAAPETAAKVSKPAWRMPPANAGKTSEPGLVMGAVSWPALGDARSTKSSEPPVPILASAAAQRVGSKPSPASPGREGSTAQTSLSEPSIQSGASGNGGNSSIAVRQKSSIKRGVTGNGMPTFWEPAPPEEISSSVMGISAPGADVVSSNQPVRGSGQMGTKAVLANAGTGDQGRVYNQRGEGVVSFPNYAGNRRHNMRDQGRGNQGYNSHNRGYVNGRDYGLALQQQRIGPRNVPRAAHPFMSASPGFINTAGFHTAGGMYYMPAPAPDLGPAYFVPPASPGVLMHGPDPMTLRVKLVNQIEYYFSVENLCRDVYLRSNMDKLGFVPVSVIANFNRVRMLTPNPNVILDALRKSTVVEVQGDRLRKRDDWVKWILPSSQHDSISTSQEDKKERAINTLQEDRRESAKSSILGKKDDDNKTRFDRADDWHDDAFITSSIPLPQENPGLHCCEKLDGLGVLQDSSVSRDAYLQTCYTEVKASDGDGHACITGRTIGSEGDSLATSRSMQSDVESTLRNGCVGDWGNCLLSDDASSVKGNSVISHLIPVAKTGNTRKERNSSASMEETTLLQVEEVESKFPLRRDPKCQPESSSSEDENDSEVNEDVQRFSIAAQPTN